MTIPSSNDIRKPLLQYLAEAREPVKLSKIIEVMGEHFSLTREEREEQVDSGGNRLRARIATIILKLKSSRIISTAKRGYLEITDKGRKEVDNYSRHVEGTTVGSPPSVEQETQEPKTDTIGKDDKMTERVTQIVASYLSKNAVDSKDIPAIIESIYKTLAGMKQPAIPTPPDIPPSSSSPTPTTSEEPAVPIEESNTDDHIICLECGKKFVSLKRHLKSHHEMTPEQYRTKWKLLPTYPMVVKRVSENARKRLETSGWGRRDKFIESIESEVQNPDKSTAK